MENLYDYVAWIAKSMQVDLDNRQLEKITRKLVQDALYNGVIKILESKIADIKTQKV